jgi:hypothetical protein
MRHHRANQFGALPVRNPLVEFLISPRPPYRMECGFNKNPPDPGRPLFGDVSSIDLFRRAISAGARAACHITYPRKTSALLDVGRAADWTIRAGGEMCQSIGAEGLGVSEPPLLPLAGGADDPGPIGAGGVRRGPHYALRSRPFANSGVDSLAAEEEARGAEGPAAAQDARIPYSLTFSRT